jgi:hypothetical protein
MKGQTISRNIKSPSSYLSQVVTLDKYMDRNVYTPSYITDSILRKRKDSLKMADVNKEKCIITNKKLYTNT